MMGRRPGFNRSHAAGYGISPVCFHLALLISPAVKAFHHVLCPRPARFASYYGSQPSSDPRSQAEARLQDHRPPSCWARQNPFSSVGSQCTSDSADTEGTPTGQLCQVPVPGAPPGLLRAMARYPYGLHGRLLHQKTSTE